MFCKIIEIRDRATFIPALAIRLSTTDPAERYLIARAGFGRCSEEQEHYVLLKKLAVPDSPMHYSSEQWRERDPHERTMFHAHRYLEQRWSLVDTGAVIDVRYILGEEERPVASERFDTMLFEQHENAPHPRPSLHADAGDTPVYPYPIEIEDAIDKIMPSNSQTPVTKSSNDVKGVRNV